MLWPIYFDADRSRSGGRKVPLHLAVKGVTAEALLKAARAAGYDAVLDPSAKHPASWFESSGRVLVRTSERKSAVLKRVALELKRMSSEARASRQRRS